MHVLTTKDLHKTYGRITAVNKLNLEIEEGTVFGLLGPNGSGKTTTLAMLLDVVKPTEGSFLWFNEKPSHVQRKRVGSILEKPNFYPNFSGYKNLQLACKIKETPESRIAEVLDQVGLFERRDSAFKTYSLGMKQRLAIASALLPHPDVLILDEPTNGLDPQGIAEIRQLIIDIAATGKTIILASHLLDEVQKVCSHFAILRNGSLIYSGSVDAGFGDSTLIQVSSDNHEDIIKFCPGLNGYISHKQLKESIEIQLEPGLNASDINKFFVEKGIYLSHINLVRKNLEQQFIDILAEHE